MVELRRAAEPVFGALALDAEQAAVLALSDPVVRVLGAPGTGKTTLAIELVAARVGAGLAPESCLVLTSSRVAAGLLRARCTTRLGQTTTEPLARTHQALGFGILRREAALRGDPAPRLLTGPEQDVILGELLAGHATGGMPAPPWPDEVRAALGTKGFRSELRDLLMRAVEHGVDADQLARLGRAAGRPEWVAAAQVLEEYDEVTALSRPGSYDPAWILTAAADLLEDDPDALDRLREQIRLVVVDDAQELTSAAARLLSVMAHPGMQVALLGDPDSAVQTFRGADPRFLAHEWTDALGVGPTVTLRTSYRQPARLAGVTASIATRIGALGGAGQRGPQPTGHGGEVEVALLRAVSQEAAHIAVRLRRAHLADAVSWSQMAVIVRGQGRDATLRRALAASGVPVQAPATEIAVRDEVAVRPLLALLEIALRRSLDPDAAIEPQTAADLLLSPVGGSDAVGLRRLRRILRREELDAGGGRTSDELLAELLTQPGQASVLGSEAAPALRLATALHRAVAAARTVQGPHGVTWAPGVSAESVLWALWQGLGIAEQWRRTALGGGQAGARADRDLDAVVALFDAAARFVDRLPHAGPDQFLEHVQGQDVPADTLIARADVGESVALLTPAAAAGRQWRYVVVAGVQEGVWPDLRLRGSLLGSEDLVAVATGRGVSSRAAAAAVRHDETRLFHVAVSRASERLLVTAVRSADEQPSVYLDLVDPLGVGVLGATGGAAATGVRGAGGAEASAGALDVELRGFTDVAAPLTLRGLVAGLRRDVGAGAFGGPSAGPDPGGTGTDEQGVAQARAAAGLAILARHGVPGADPASWWAQTALSDDRPLRAPDEPVRVPPSKVESFAQCSLRWLLTTMGGDGPGIGAATIGALVHDIAHEVGDADAATFEREVDDRWGRLGMAPGWVSDRKRTEAIAMVGRLATYVERARDQGWARVGSELPIDIEVGRAAITGRVDRLERDPEGRLRTIDFKTGGKSFNDAAVQEHPQLATYQLAVEEGAFAEHGSESAGAALVQLGKAATKANPPLRQLPPAEQADPQWAHRLVAEVADGMGGGQFAAAQGAWCARCPVKGSCPAQPEGECI